MGRGMRLALGLGMAGQRGSKQQAPVRPRAVAAEPECQLYQSVEHSVRTAQSSSSKGKENKQEKRVKKAERIRVTSSSPSNKRKRAPTGGIYNKTSFDEAKAVSQGRKG